MSTTKAPSLPCLLVPQPLSPQFTGVSLRTPTGLGPPTTYPRPHKWVFIMWGSSCVLKDSSFGIYCMGFFSFILFLTASFDCCFGFFCVQALCASPGYHCPLSFGCAIFECGGVSVYTCSTLTTLVTTVSYPSVVDMCVLTCLPARGGSFQY